MKTISLVPTCPLESILPPIVGRPLLRQFQYGIRFRYTFIPEFLKSRSNYEVFQPNFIFSVLFLDKKEGRKLITERK